MDGGKAESVQALPWPERLAWLLAIWLGSVAALGVLAGGMRLLMNLAGMTS